MKSAAADEISAGGVVWHRRQVLVLRNFRNEYIFPKGHLEPGETPLEAALREVFEESGLEVTVLAALPDTNYRYEDSSGAWHNKRVHWYNMRASCDEVQVDGDEIHWGAFMPPEVAAKRLTHFPDRALLAQALAMMSNPPLIF